MLVLLILKNAFHLIVTMAKSARLQGGINNNNNKGYPMKAIRACKTLPSPKKFVLRLPPSVHEKILITAKRHRRSMNAEIIHHLERILPTSIVADAPPLPMHDTLLDEEHCLGLLRTLPTHKRSALLALLEDLTS